MLRIGWILCLGMWLQQATAQKITYSEYNRKEGQDINFEILGRIDSGYLVYKNIHRNHFITRYDRDMKITDHKEQSYIPDRTFNLDFITYPKYAVIVYQYQRNSVVYCMASKIDGFGNKIDGPRLLDSTQIGFLADNSIYSLAYSENKEKVLIYKRQVRRNELTVVSKLYDVQWNLLDSTRQNVAYDDRRDFFSEMVVDNSGNYVFVRGTGKSRGASNMVHVMLHRPGVDTFRTYSVSLNEKYVSTVGLKADNLNKACLINGFYLDKKYRVVEGLFTGKIDLMGEKPMLAVFNQFSDSMRMAINPSDRRSFSFDNLNIQQTVMKRKGGIVLAAEDFYTETMFNNTWNRSYLYNNNYYSGTGSDYYLYNPYYYGYRPWSSSNYRETIRYYYNDVVMLSLDSSLKLEWNNIIRKRQYDIETDNFLSFGTFNTGGEWHFLYLDRDGQRQIISNQAVMTNGELVRYPTIRSQEVGYGFMPKLAKQIGAREVIVPYVYMSYIAFAKIEFE